VLYSNRIVWLVVVVVVVVVLVVTTTEKTSEKKGATDGRIEWGAAISPKKDDSNIENGNE
jgi:hypothetical protein